MELFRKVHIKTPTYCLSVGFQELLKQISNSSNDLYQLCIFEQASLITLYRYNKGILANVLSHLESVVPSVQHRAGKLLTSLSFDKLACEQMLYEYKLNLCKYFLKPAEDLFLEHGMSIFANIAYNCPQSIDLELFSAFYARAKSNGYLLSCFMYLMLNIARCAHDLSASQLFTFFDVFFDVISMVLEMTESRRHYEFNNYQMILAVLTYLCQVPMFYDYINDSYAVLINKALKNVKGPGICKCIQFLSIYLFNFTVEQVVLILDGLCLRDSRILASQLELLDQIVDCVATKYLNGVQLVVMRYTLVAMYYYRLLKAKCAEQTSIDAQTIAVCNRLFLPV